MGQATWVAGRTGGGTVAADWISGTAPLATDDVTLPGPADAYQLVSGSGASASLNLVGNTSLAGWFTTGALRIGTSAAPGALALTGGTTLSAASATLLYGPLLATGPNTTLIVSGALTLGGATTGASSLANTLTVSGGASVKAGSLTLVAAGNGNLVTVDASSSLEVGSIGSAGPGTIVVDAGQSVTGAGNLSAPGGIVEGGAITAQGGVLSLYARVTGGGQLRIAAGARL